ncbi:MAG TPA: glycosyltransferase family 2 protein [Actinomycetota bacterium]|nr:glycosyltransferase family 2 protein [Actinomycetota bacterium]
MPASQPRVIAIVVNHNGRAFLRDTFRGLAAQTRPIDDVLVVDTGSTDGSADWARSRLGDDAVLAVRGQFGRAVMSALRDSRTAGVDWLWLLHDDCAPEPEALEALLAEAESRPSASILGPKLVSWTNPDRLAEIGFSIDRTGRAVSPIEDDEIDQGQHDQIQDVFFVNTAGMLVRRGALLSVGGFDERMPAFRDDLDLCWRTHLSGGRVLVVPQARVRHFAAAASRSRRTRAVGHPRYLIERHTTAAMLKATSLRKLPFALLLAMVGALARATGLALTGRPADALAVLWAWGWNVKELPVTIVHRRRLQRQRKVDDSALAPLRAPGGQRLRALLRGTLELVYGAEVGAHVAQRTDDTGEEQDMPSTGVSAVRIVAGHPVAFMVAGFALVMAISLRSVLVAPAIASIGLGVWPATAAELLREFASSFHRAEMGSTASAPPSLALLGGLSVLAFGKALVAEKLLLWLALPLAAATCTRALRVVVPQLWARALAGLLYATAPLATGALAQGRIGELVLLVLAPPALAQVVLAFREDQPREPWRPALRFAALAAVAIAMSPAAVVTFGLVVAGAIVVALARAGAAGRQLAVRQSLLLGGGFVLALALLLPWSGRLLTGSAFAALGRSLAVPGLADLLQLRPGGGGVPGPLVGPIYPALALAGLFFAPPERRKQAFWLVGGFMAAAVAAAMQAKGLGPRVTDWPAGLLVPGAVAWAAAAGLGLAGIGHALRRLDARFSLQRVTAAGLVLVSAVTGLLLAGHLVRGDWSPMEAVDSPALPATVTRGQARVLWLAGRPDHGVDFAVTGPKGRTLLDPGRPPAVAADDLGEVVTDIVQARTHRAGSMLRMFGIGYVVVRPGADAGRLVDLVARQQDLDAKPTEQAALFAGPGVPQTAWVIPGETPPAEVQAMLTSPAQPDPIPDPATGKVEANGPGTVVLLVPEAEVWRATVGGARLEPTTALGWAQGFKLPAGTTGELEVQRTGQERRLSLLLIQALLILATVATMARPTRVAPPVAPSAGVDDTSGGDLRLAGLARGGVAR